MWPYILIGIVVLLVFAVLIIFNNFVILNNKVKEAFSTMDVYLKKRWDLIPNLVETVKGYAKHEKDTLTEVVKLRNANYDDLSESDKLTTNDKVGIKLGQIMLLAEKYPDLKASDNFKELSKELAEVEDEIAHARKYYNATIRDFNNKVEMFPSNIIAKLFGYKTKEMYEAKENERENIKVDI